MNGRGARGNEDSVVENFCCENSSKSKEPEFRLVPAITNPAPYWSAPAVVDANATTDLSLNHYKGKYLVMLFYRHDFSVFDRTEIIQFNDRVEEFRVSGCEVIAISTDSEFSHLAWRLAPRDQGGLGPIGMAMISDANHGISKAYGVLDEKKGVSAKALFVVDENQSIRYVSIGEPGLARSVDETLRIVESCISEDGLRSTE